MGEFEEEGTENGDDEWEEGSESGKRWVGEI